VRGIPEDAYRYGRSICYAAQGAEATARRITLPFMDEAELLLWRIERLQAAIDRLDEGNLNAFGRRMGWSDGSYVGQMLRGARAISEKFVRKFESETGLRGWFDPTQAQREDSLEYQVRTEIAMRSIPEHVLQTILDLVRGYPKRGVGNKSAHQ
jgi:hypothetical protein